MGPNKDHEHDGISIRMIKLCPSSISKPLFSLFKHRLENECFPDEIKKANIVSIHQKGDKQLIQNHRPVSLLPICGKIFEKLVFNTFNTYDFYKSLDANLLLEVTDIFLDISKAFDRGWHEGLFFKLKRLGLSGKYYGLINLYHRTRHQRVILDSQSSKWSSIKVVVPPGSIFGPWFLLVYINDSPNGLLSNPKLFADDTSILSVVKDHLNSSNKLSEDLSKISQ